jgi:hypothetical protein
MEVVAAEGGLASGFGVIWAAGIGVKLILAGFIIRYWLACPGWRQRVETRVTAVRPLGRVGRCPTCSACAPIMARQS